MSTAPNVPLQRRRIHLWWGQPAYWCPVCDHPHMINTDTSKPGPAWSWNGDYDYPSIGPSAPGEKFSVLYFSDRPSRTVWRLARPGKTGADEYPTEEAALQARKDAGLNVLLWKPEKVHVAAHRHVYCHTYVRNGTIQILPDSERLGRRTMPLPEWVSPKEGSWQRP